MLNKMRWVVLFWLFLVGVLAYMDRTNFAISAPLIMREFGIDQAQIGLIMSAFTLGYAVPNFPGGFIVQRLGGRLTLTSVLLFWSLMTLASGFAWSFSSMLIIRILFGAGEGPHFPSNAKITDMWVKPTERAIASGLWVAALPLGIILGQMLCASLASLWGWRSTFTSLGIAGLCIACLTWVIVRDKPEDHPYISKEELKIIVDSKLHVGHTASASGMTAFQVITNPWAWIIFFIFLGLGMTFWANVNWLPTYFVQARGFDLKKSGFLSSIPWLLCIVSPFIIGWFSDKLGEGRRAPTLIIWQIIPVPFIAYAVYTSNITWCLVSFCIALFFVWGCISLMWTVPFEIFHSADGAKVGGMMLTGGSIAGILAPTLAGYIARETRSFNLVYYILASFQFIGFLLAIALLYKERSVRQSRV